MEQLWSAVLAQAVADALGQSGFNRKDYTVRGVLHSPHAEALAWFEQGGPDFHAICGLAGIDGDALRERVLSGRVGPLYFGAETRKRTPKVQGRAA